MHSSLFERIGGEGAVLAAVELLYEKILGDEKLRPFFDGLDIDAQVKKQVSFMTLAFGGPPGYSGKDLRTAHASLVSRGLTDEHFNAVATHLEASLKELGVGEDLIREVLGLVEGTRHDVLGRTNGDTPGQC
jgi:hemoglobin